MSMNVTPVLHLNLPPFDSAPWDEDVNDNFLILDGAISQVFGVANFAGLWKNSTDYVAGQEVLDETDSSLWLAGVTHTSSAPPVTFADERLAHPTYWTQVGNSAADYAQAAADAAAEATAANAAAQVASASANNAQVAAEAAAASAEANVSNSVLKTGSTMTGLLVLSGDPLDPVGAATKQYVDARVGGVGFVKTTGDIMTGPLLLPNAAPVDGNEATRKLYVDNQIATRMPVSGGSFTGNINVVNSYGFTDRTDSWISVTAANFYIAFQNPWGLVFDRTNGNLLYRNHATTTLFNMTGGGDTITLNTSYANQHYSYGTTNAGYLYSRGNCDIAGSMGITGGLSVTGNISSSSNLSGANITVTGTVNAATVNASGNVIASAGVIAYGTMVTYGNRLICQGGASPSISMFWPGVGSAGMFYDAGGSIWISAMDGGGNLAGVPWMAINNDGISVRKYGTYDTCVGIDRSGNISVILNGYKPGGGPWAASSDARIKDILGNYTHGLSEITQLNPVRYIYNEKAEHIHSTKEFVGLIAQEVEDVMPEMVTESTGKIDGVEVQDLRLMDTTPLIFAVINAIKELDNRLGVLEGA